MNKDTEELIKIDEDSIFIKIKKIFKKLFKKDEKNIEVIEEKEISINAKKENFNEYIKKIENDQTRLLKIQKLYRDGRVKEEDLTKEEINKLSKLYDNQITNLKKSNEIRKQKIYEYRKRTQASS